MKRQNKNPWHQLFWPFSFKSLCPSGSSSSLLHLLVQLPATPDISAPGSTMQYPEEGLQLDPTPDSPLSPPRSMGGAGGTSTLHHERHPDGNHVKSSTEGERHTGCEITWSWANSSICIALSLSLCLFLCHLFSFIVFCFVL